MKTIEIYQIENIDESLKIANFKDTYVVPLHIISKLMSIELPIKDRIKSIENILMFLNYLDHRIDFSNSTLIPLSRKILAHHFSFNTVSKYLDILSDIRILKKVPYEDGTWFKPKDKSLQYRVMNEYCYGELCIVTIDSNNRRVMKCEINIHNKFKKAIMNTEIDIKNAIIAEIDYCGRELNKLRIRLSKLFAIKNKREISIGDEVDRIYHSFSNISKISRQFQSVEGLKYNNIDIVNCQPMLLCYYLKQHKLAIDENYIEDCENGVFYERFIGMNVKITEKKNNWTAREIITARDDVKLQLYRSIFFNLDNKNPINKEFAKIYPIAFKSLNKLSTTRTIASILQNLEAEIFNSLIPKKSKYFYTLFDAIYYTSKEDTEFLTKRLKDKFKELGLNVTLKVEENDIFDKDSKLK